MKRRLPFSEIMATAREIPGAFLDYLIDHRWAAILVQIVVSVLACLITIFLIALLAAAGYIPPPQW